MENEIEADNDEIGFDISASFTIPIPWDILVTASDSCLRGYAPGFVEHEIIKQLPASVTYRLWQIDLGELGTVEVRKLGVNNAEINISGVPSNSIDNAPMWLRVKPEWDKRINETFKGKQRLQEQEPETEAYFSVSNEIDKAKARIRAKQKNHQANVIKAYFDRLVHDLNIWMSNKVMPPPYMLAIAGLTEWPDKRMLSKEAQDYFEKFKLEISKSVMQQVDVTKNVKQQSKSGRPHLPEDVWAWEQVNQYNRPKTEVYKEWRERDDVKARNLQDPERQFDRITDLEWKRE